MPKIFDYTADCFDGDYSKVDFDSQSIIWIHRIGPGIGSNAVEIAKFFTHGEGRQYTNGNMAYSYINTAEQIQQALPLDDKGAHARRWGNAHGIGFAQIGDFNKQAPSEEQWNRAVDFCADVVPWLSSHSSKMHSLLPGHLEFEIPVIGHGEVSEAYGEDSGKAQPDGLHACPGRLWDMEEFRRDVETMMREKAAQQMADLGHRFTRHG
jgi:hypothetical protein